MRDLLGITRALYRATLTQTPRDLARLQALDEIGKTLRAALAEAHAARGTIAHSNAYAAAERATQALGELVGNATPLQPLIAAAARCFTRPGSMG